MVWSFLLSLAYYPEYFGFLAWFSLVRPIMIITSLKGRQSFNAAYFFSFFFVLFSLYWLALVTIPGVFTTVVLVAFYYTFVFMLFVRLYHFKSLYGIILFPFFWVGLEYFRTLSEFAFPWSELGYTQSYYLYILQIVSVISVHGLSFLIVLVNVLLWQVLRKSNSPEQRLTAFLVSAAMVLGLVSYGWIEMPKYPIPGKVEVAMLQGSLSIEEKWAPGNADRSFFVYDSLAVSAKDSNIVLYVWPETSAPTYLSHVNQHRQKVAQICRETNGYHLVGSLGATIKDGRQKIYNSCYQFAPDGRMEKRYDKMKLVPFSEHVPYQDYVPFMQKEFLRKYLSFIDNYSVQWWSDFYPGDSLSLFSLPDYNYGALICFETTFPEFVREAVNMGADFMVGITNDTWFKRSVGIHQHSRIFITRMVENRIWGVRAANSGLTYIVDGYGRIRDELDLYEVAALKGKINILEDKTIFTRYGDIAGLFSFLITVSIIGILLVLWLIQKIFIRK